MATEVKLPDLGEGVTDATVSRWRVKIGDRVSAGDIILEVATDKVDTEVAAPVDGTILRINAREGDLVDAGAVLALIGAEGETVESGSGHGSAKPTPAPQIQAEAKAETKAAEPSAPAVPSENGHGAKVSPVARRVAAEKGVDLEAVAGSGPGGRITKDDVLMRAEGKHLPALPGEYASAVLPSIARLAAENNISLDEVAAGRPFSALTRYDVMSAVAARATGKDVTVEPRFLPPRGGQPKPAPRRESATPILPPQGERAAEAAPAKPAPKPPAPKPEAPALQLGPGDELVKHSRMRTAIARSTTQSLFTAPHVTTMWDVNMSAVLAHRQAHKNEFAAAGVNLTITAYLVEAIIAGLKAVPAANATYTDEGVIIRRTYNIGMAVALPQDQYGLGGLIVPVIKNAGELNLLGLARAVNELADKARRNQLKAEDLADGTFTLSNYGTSGSRFQTPIIVQPQVGILGVGAIEKRAVVVSQGHPLEANTGDYLAFLPMTTLGFSYDHRVLDGATADAFCAVVKKTLESY